VSQGVHEWLDSVKGPQWSVFFKVLAGNDTLLTRSHQAGPYIPRAVLFRLFPTVAVSTALNPRATLPIRIDSHGVETTVSAIWYNNRIVAAGTRNETRITGWGGRSSPVLDPESTGSLCAFAFLKFGEGDAEACRIWLCTTLEEEEAITARVGAVEPGVSVFIDPHREDFEFYGLRETDAPCRLAAEQMPADWKFTFPSAAAILQWTLDNLPRARRLPADQRLLMRRDCEFELFRSIEEVSVLPRIMKGFATVDLFVEFANAVTNRRKARSGMSLELQTRTILDEEGVSYSHGAISEHGKRPDFLFPSADAYRSAGFPAERLRMLGVKTTVKDRWRQVLDEAGRIPVKHLLTLQHGVSPRQFEQMRLAGIRLVVPRPLQKAYVASVRQHLVTLADFVLELRRVFD
jgi:hypothetical protein